MLAIYIKENYIKFIQLIDKLFENAVMEEEDIISFRKEDFNSLFSSFKNIFTIININDYLNKNIAFHDKENIKKIIIKPTDENILSTDTVDNIIYKTVSEEEFTYLISQKESSVDDKKKLGILKNLLTNAANKSISLHEINNNFKLKLESYITVLEEENTHICITQDKSFDLNENDTSSWEFYKNEISNKNYSTIIESYNRDKEKLFMKIGGDFQFDLSVRPNLLLIKLIESIPFLSEDEIALLKPVIEQLIEDGASLYSKTKPIKQLIKNQYKKLSTKSQQDFFLSITKLALKRNNFFFDLPSEIKKIMAGYLSYIDISCYSKKNEEIDVFFSFTNNRKSKEYFAHLKEKKYNLDSSYSLNKNYIKNIITEKFQDEYDSQNKLLQYLGVSFSKDDINYFINKNNDLTQLLNNLLDNNSYLSHFFSCASIFNILENPINFFHACRFALKTDNEFILTELIKLLKFLHHNNNNNRIYLHSLLARACLSAILDTIFIHEISTTGIELFSHVLSSIKLDANALNFLLYRAIESENEKITPFIIEKIHSDYNFSSLNFSLPLELALTKKSIKNCQLLLDNFFYPREKLQSEFNNLIYKQLTKDEIEKIILLMTYGAINHPFNIDLAMKSLREEKNPDKYSLFFDLYKTLEEIKSINKAIRHVKKLNLLLSEIKTISLPPSLPVSIQKYFLFVILEKTNEFLKPNSLAKKIIIQILDTLAYNKKIPIEDFFKSNKIITLIDENLKAQYEGFFSTSSELKQLKQLKEIIIKLDNIISKPDIFYQNNNNNPNNSK